MKDNIMKLAALTGDRITDMPNSWNPLFSILKYTETKGGYDLSKIDELDFENKHKALLFLKAENLDMEEFYSKEIEPFDFFRKVEEKKGFKNIEQAMQLFEYIMKKTGDIELKDKMSKHLDVFYENNPTLKIKKQNKDEPKPKLVFTPTINKDEVKNKNKIKI